jgi:hypothetical protein
VRTRIFSWEYDKSGIVIRPRNVGLDENVWMQNLASRNKFPAGSKM